MRAWLVGILAVAIGIGAWEIVLLVHPTREAWDVREYWLAAYPAMIVASAILGYLAPVLPWRWGVATAMGQGLWVLLRISVRSGIPNLWPFSLLLFGLMAVPCALAAWAGSAVSSHGSPGPSPR